MGQVQEIAPRDQSAAIAVSKQTTIQGYGLRTLHSAGRSIDQVVVCVANSEADTVCFYRWFRFSASPEFREIGVRSRGASFPADDFVFLQL